MREQTKERIRAFLTSLRTCAGSDPAPTCDECQQFYGVVTDVLADDRAELNSPQGDLETIRRLEGQMFGRSVEGQPVVSSTPVLPPGDYHAGEITSE